MMYSKEYLLNCINELNDKIGHTPRKEDLKLVPISSTPFTRAFGSWNKALIECGLPLYSRKGLQQKRIFIPKFTKDDIINIIKQNYKDTNKIPTNKNIKGINLRTVVNAFGTWKNALKESGLERIRKTYIKKGYKKHTIEMMQEIAESRGGKCLSEKYIGSQTRLKWECSKGHLWTARPANIISGSWCIYCGMNVSSIEKMKEFAISRGGKCLSEVYVKSNRKLKWQCSEGHIWEAKPNSVATGHKSWCPVCSKLKRYPNFKG